jgi:hypothetical protein
MRTILHTLILLSLSACGSGHDGQDAGSSATAAVGDFAARLEWTLSPEATAAGIPAGFGHQIDLKNNYRGNWIQYRPRNDGGVNIGWVVAPQGEFTLHRQSGAPGPTKYDELLAIHNKYGGFLRYKEREYGINLVYDPSPSYEWQFKGSLVGTLGSAPVGLYNTRIKQFVVYCDREYGIQLKWAKDCNR